MTENAPPPERKPQPVVYKDRQEPTRWETFNTNLVLCSGLITAAFAIVAGWLSGKPWHLILGIAFACFVFAPAISLVVYGELDPDKDKYHPWL